MAYQFESLDLADESELVDAAGDYVLVGLDMGFRDDVSGSEARVQAQVPVLGLVQGRTIDHVHEDAAHHAEDLVRAAGQHLEENDPQLLARFAQGY
ncbi:hypothetical protein [Thiohalorhabdus sp.]|uniref:hypothetical protein n=1 Tax=Thiohalorhabdus sp. TaxID=3094134 RepID=UPI002FC34FA9